MEPRIQYAKTKDAKIGGIAKKRSEEPMRPYAVRLR